jgi:hypothetical protein
MSGPHTKRTNGFRLTFASLCATFLVALWLLACCTHDAALSVGMGSDEPMSCCVLAAGDEALAESASCCGGCGETAAGNCACGLIPGRGCCCSAKRAQGLAACSSDCGCGDQSNEPLSGGSEPAKRTGKSAWLPSPMVPPMDPRPDYPARGDSVMVAPECSMEPRPPRLDRDRVLSC